MTAALIATLAIPLTDVEEARVGRLGADFRFLLSEYEVHDRIQLHLFDAGYKSFSTFAVWADDRVNLRKVIARDLVDPDEAGLTAIDIRQAALITNQLMAAWLAASTRLTEDIRLSTEAKLLRLPTMISRSALQSLRLRYENEHGRCKDSVYPCASMIEKRLEEVEEGSFRAVPLTEVISELLGSDEHTTVQDLGNSIRVRKAPSAILMPMDSEELRARFETLSISYILAAYKHGSRTWLQSTSHKVWDQYVRYLLSDEVSAYKLDRENLSIRATWATVLDYDFHMRKQVVRLVLFDGVTLADALSNVIKDLSIKERYFITPTAMINASGKRLNATSEAQNTSTPLLSNKKRKLAERQAKWKVKSELPENPGKKPNKGKGKGGKGGGKGSLKKTPDGRLICSFFQTHAGCVKPGCQFVHCCEICYGKHPTVECKAGGA